MSDAAPPLADGRYRLLSVLGVGGMATVYRAFDGRLQVPRAIKILSPELGLRRSLRSRFEGEASMMALLEHPNIVRVYDVGADGDRAYIVMELVDGGSLLDRVKSGGALPPNLALRVTIDMLDALDVAHKRGVVHRDIKPHNILLSSDGNLRITDFGIARMGKDKDDSLTKTGAVMGTWGFMAPEQRADAKSVDERADLYSVGATLYSILTGKTPVDLFVSDMDSSLLKGIDHELAQIIKKSTRYNREERYATAAEMAAACRTILALVPADPANTPPMFSPPEGSTIPQIVRGGGTGLLGAASSAPRERPSSQSANRVPGPFQSKPAMQTMVPDLDEPAQASSFLSVPKPALEKADAGLAAVEQERDTVGPQQKAAPWGVGLGVAALVLAGLGLGLNLMGDGSKDKEPVLPPPGSEPVVVVDPTPDPPVLDPISPVLEPVLAIPVLAIPEAKAPVVKTAVLKEAVLKQTVVKEAVVKEAVVVSPALTHSKPKSATIGSPITITAVAPSGDYTLTLYYRGTGAGSKYTSRSMRSSGNSFSVQITPDEECSGGLEYYIQAKPTGGGALLKKGSGFSPIKVPMR